MRIRIALTTAVAVIVVAVPVVFFTFFSSTPDASAKAVRHSAAAQTRPDRSTTSPGMKLMSYAQAERVSRMVAYANVVTVQQEESYLREVSYLKALQAQQTAQAAAARAAAQHAVSVPATPTPVAPAAPAPAPAPTPAGGGSDATTTATADWACIREHESGDNYSEYNGGAYQFELGTWEGLTGLSSPAQDSPPAVQDAAALRLYAERGFEPWTTRYVCGL